MQPHCISIPRHRPNMPRRAPSVVRCVNSVRQTLYSICHELQLRQVVISVPVRYAGQTGSLAGIRDIQNLHITNIADSV